MYRSSPLRSIAIGPQKRALREKKEEKQQIPMGGGCTTARAQRHPEGTTRCLFHCSCGKLVKIDGERSGQDLSGRKKVGSSEFFIHSCPTSAPEV